MIGLTHPVSPVVAWEHAGELLDLFLVMPRVDLEGEGEGQGIGGVRGPSDTGLDNGGF